MQIRSTFSEGLESELPSSLPSGYPFYATDTRCLFIGRGDDLPPESVLSGIDRVTIERLTSLENFATRLREELDIRLGQIGERDVDEEEIGDGKLIYYDMVSDTYRFVDPLIISNGTVGGDTADQQVTLRNVVATATKPYKIYIDIPYTLNFNRRPLEVLKFLESQDNVVTIAATYDNSEASQFVENKYILFDGSMKLRIHYPELMDIYSESATSAVYKSIAIDFDEFKLIEELSVTNATGAGAIHSLVEAGGTHYKFVDSEWVDTILSDPTGVEFVAQGMTNLKVTTNVTTNSRVTFTKLRSESTGYIFEANIDRDLLKEVQRISIRE